MFLQLLASALSTAPEIDTELKQAESEVGKITEIKSVQDLEVIAGRRYQQFPFEGGRPSVNLRTFEVNLLKSKHYRSDDEQEEEFV
jgi:hypothetical protein